MEFWMGKINVYTHINHNGHEIAEERNVDFRPFLTPNAKRKSPEEIGIVHYSAHVLPEEPE